MTFLESLGIDQSYVYVMVMFVAIFLFICSLIKNNIVRAVVATVGVVFIAAQMCAEIGRASCRERV